MVPRVLPQRDEGEISVKDYSKIRSKMEVEKSEVRKYTNLPGAAEANGKEMKHPSVRR